jgi:hypothetical protein
MKKLLIYLIVSLLISCNNPDVEKKIDIPKKDSFPPSLISNSKKLADSPFLTTSHYKNPVLSWVEGEEKEAYLYYVTSEDNGKTFSSPIEVTPTKGLTPHHETMPKLAFKKNGTVVVVFQKRNSTSKNRFAGAIFYSQSFDNGKTWTKSNYLHSDTSEGIGRSFFDIVLLPDGEIGAVWLDGRKRQKDGSTLCFAKTNANNGFGKDKEIGQKTCQCCRTDIFVDNQKKIHVAYRDIINDSIRDIVHLSSTDNGNTFSNSKRISADNWVINGCPHTGPSITNTENGVSFFWFTSGGKEGVFNTQLTNNSAEFTERILINPHARHPQAITLKNGTIVLTWDETFKTEEGYINKIGVMFRKKDGTNNIEYLTSEKVDSSHPVLLEVENNCVLISWTQRILEQDNTKVYYKIVSL